MLFSFRDNKTYSCRSKTSGGVGMYKNQLQELAQRSCFNLPSYACIREGPDHAPRFKASVNFNGEIFEGPSYCTTLRQAEHAAAEVALNTLSTRGPSRSLAARVLDETGVYKNLLQETAHRAGLKLPVYTTVRSGPGHLPVFTCTVELAGMNFAGEPAKTKKQAEKNAAMTAWSALKQMPYLGSSSNKETESSEEPEQGVVAKVLSNFRPKYENKSLKQRDQNQARRRVVSGYRDNSSGSSTHNTLQYRQWRSMDLLSDFSSIYPSQQQNQQQNCFSALLPPLTASKILPSTSRENKPSLYSSNRPIPVQVRSRSQVKTQEVTPPLEEHQKDEEEWLGGKSDITEKSIEKDPSANSSCVFTPNPTHQRPFPLPHAGNLNTPMSDYSSRQAQIRTKPFRPPTPIGTITPSAIPLPRFLNTGRYYTQGIAPAVNIRSVIPVCAAPPMRPLSSDPPTLQMKETSHQLSASVSKQTEEELASANSKLNKLQL